MDVVVLLAQLLERPRTHQHGEFSELGPSGKIKHDYKFTMMDYLLIDFKTVPVSAGDSLRTYPQPSHFLKYPFTQ